MFCPDCGSEVAEGRRFCGKCGGQLRASSGGVEAVQGSLESPAPTVAPIPRPPVSTRQKLVYVLVALLAVLGGVGWWWFHRPAPPYKVQDPGIYPFQGLSADGKTQKWGFIDVDGKIIDQPEWDAVSYQLVLGRAVACNEGLCGVQKEAKWGYVDTSGHAAISNQFDSAGPFVEGLAKVNLGNQVGFIDKTGKYVINPQFHQAGDFHDGLAAVLGDGGWGFINKAGAYVIKPKFQPAAADGFSEGLAEACLSGMCGYIDRNGSFAIKPQFNSENIFSEGLAAVQMNGKWGYVNTAGNIVINPQFDQVTNFFGGLAAVTVSGHQGTINKQGKYVVNPGQYSLFLQESDPLPAVNRDGAGLLTKDAERGLLTRDGKWVVRPSMALTCIGPIYGKVFQGCVGGQMVPISTSGKVLAGPYKGATLDNTLAQDIDNENSAESSVHSLIMTENSYNFSNPTKGYTSDLAALGKIEGSAEMNGADQIDSALATGTKDGYQFTITIPAGTSTGGTNFNYFLVAKPAAGHAGRSFCADSSGAVRYAVQGAECTATSPTL